MNALATAIGTDGEGNKSRSSSGGGPPLRRRIGFSSIPLIRASRSAGSSWENGWSSITLALPQRQPHLEQLGDIGIAPGTQPIDVAGFPGPQPGDDLLHCRIVTAT